MFHPILTSTLLICLTQLILVQPYGLKHIERFSHPEIQYYKQLLFDVPNYKLLIGARDYILTLSLDNFDSVFKRVYYIPAEPKKLKQCEIKGMKKEQCHNFITVLLPIPSSNHQEMQILVCGTNAYSPQCEIRPLASMDTLTSSSEPINSYSPLWNTTSLITSDGEFFYGGPLDLRGIDSSITRQLITLNTSVKAASVRDKRIIRSAQHDSRWINADANFVYSFEYQSHVYFLFRESAVEYLNCGKRIYSRIGRVCKNDPGMRDNWTSFLKTRLNCSIPGLFPFYFDEIQSVDWIDNGGSPTLYAIFNTPENSIHGSAVCAFSIHSILDAFQGSFKYQKSSTHIWESVDDRKDVFECGASTNYSEHENNLRLNSVYQLMDNAVQPVNGKPYMVSKSEYFKFIAVDVIKTKLYDSVEVIFIVTTEGKLMKYVKWPALADSCLVDEIQLVDPKEDQILSMKFLKDTQSLYLGTEKEVLRVSVHRCHLFHSKEKCLSSGDPYCGWSQIKMKCIRAPGNNYRLESWIQSDTPRCSNDRWSKWFVCQQHDKSAEEYCKCRKRPCPTDNQNCLDGFEIEVTNCTQHGGWSEWSAWSSCSASCGLNNMQYRTRTCTNPLPLHNGHPCQGPSREERVCHNTPPCIWSEWSEWSNCTQSCSIFELKKRTRKCLNYDNHVVEPSNCKGTHVDEALCDNCKKSKWSDWLITEINGNEVIEQRNEIITHDSSVQPKNERRVISLQYCERCDGYLYDFRGKEVLIKECSCNGHFEWDQWKEWSLCVNGTQSRYRKCLSKHLCTGHYMETRYCQPSLAYAGGNEIFLGDVETTWNKSTTLFLICTVSMIISSCLTWFVFMLLHKRSEKPKPDLGLIKHTNSEPNTYEEPEKYRVTTPLNGGPHATLTRTSTLKRDFKNTSFRAKLDDSNYN